MTEYPKPCDKYHPLPCGLDRDCVVPVEYYDSEKDSQEIYDRYQADQ